MTPTPSPSPVSSAPPARASSAANLRVCQGTSSVGGVDVSDYDPSTQWTTVQHSGRGFAFIKATEGTTYTNPLYASDWSSSKSAGLLRGAYHFFHPGDDPTVQAQFFLRTMGALGANDLPPLLDWEVTDSMSSATQIENALIWLQAVEAATGKIPVIYVAPAFWNALGNPTEFARYPLFIANYDTSCPDVPPPWSTWTFWQTGTGTASGLSSSEADLDVFNGTLTQLTSFATTGSF